MPIGDGVRIVLRDIGLPELLLELRALVDRAGGAPRERVARFQLRSVPPSSGQGPAEYFPGRIVLNAAMDWIHVVLRSAVAKLVAGNGDLPGLTVSAATVADLLDVKPARTANDTLADIQTADAELARALANNDAQAEPLVRAAQVFSLSGIEFRLLLMTLAPELDIRYQRCMGLLLDDLSRRVGTLGLYAALLGEPSQVRRELAQTGNLWRWRVFDCHPGTLAPADEPLRLDPPIVGWLLGRPGALDHDPRVRRAARLVSWPGDSLLDTHSERDYAAELVGKFQGAAEMQWLVLGNDDSAAWRALLELGAKARQLEPIRVETPRLMGLDVEIEESGVRRGANGPPN